MVELPWLSDALVAMVLAVAVSSGGRLLAAAAWHRPVQPDVEVLHIAMGLSMAGMLKANFAVFTPSAWVAVFVGAALWFGRRPLRGLAAPGATRAVAHAARHVVGSGAMVYMLWAMPRWTGTAEMMCGSRLLGMASSGMSPTKLPYLALVLGIFLLGQSVMLVDRHLLRPAKRSSVTTAVVPEWPTGHSERDLVGTPAGPATLVDTLPPRGEDVRPGRTAHLSVVCQILMSLTMGYMLLTLS